MVAHVPAISYVFVMSTCDAFFSRLLAFLLVAGLALASAPSAAGQSPGTRSFDAQDLEQAGVYRLSDLYWLVDDWTAYTLNGYTWHAAPTGLSSPRSPDWRLLVDGRPVELGALGTQDINNLPLRIDDIDRVEVSSLPAMTAGRIARAGVIEVHTSKPERPLEASASAIPGSEIGDPGPYEYTRHGTLNVDRIGPSYGATVSTQLGSLSTRVGARLDERHASHHIRPRVNTLCNGDCRIRGAPIIDHTSFYGQLGVDDVLGSHRLSLYRTSLVDQHFFAPAGLELPSNYELVDGGLAGTLPLSQRVHVNYDASYSHLAHNKRVEQAGLDWRQERFQGRLELERNSEAFEDLIGLRVDQTTGRSWSSLGSETLTTWHLYRSLSFERLDAWRHDLAAGVYVVGKEFGFDVLTTTSYSPSRAHTLSLTTSFAQRPLANAQNLYYWMIEGYEPVLDHESVEQHVPEVPSRSEASTTFTADLLWQSHLLPTLAVEYRQGVRVFEGMTTAGYHFSAQADNPGLLPWMLITPHGRGTAFTSAATLELNLLPGLEQRFHAGYLALLHSNGYFAQHWESHPPLRLGYTARYTPVERLSLFARLRYLAPTDWPAFGPAAEEDPENYTDRLPPAWQLNLTARKDFWHDRLSLSLSLRNVLSKPIQFHPAGAPIDMAFFLEARLRL